MIDIAKKLRNVKPGITLYSPAWGSLRFTGLHSNGSINCIREFPDGSACNFRFDKFGRIIGFEAESILFPSLAERDWNNFDGIEPLAYGARVMYRVKQDHPWILGKYAGHCSVLNDGIGENLSEVRCHDIIPVRQFDYENATFEHCDNYGTSFAKTEKEK